MAALTAEKRAEVHAGLMRANTETVTITKAQLRAAVDAIDQWVSDNAASFNAAIPQPARGALSAAQKSRLLMMVVAKRFAEGA
jgi:hypothetical protein